MANPILRRLFGTPRSYEVVSHFRFAVASGVVGAFKHKGIVLSASKTGTGTYDLVTESWPANAVLDVMAHVIAATVVVANGIVCTTSVEQTSSTSAPKITLVFRRSDTAAAADPPDGDISGSIFVKTQV